MKKKILRVIINSVEIVLIIVGVVLYIQSYYVQKQLVSSSKEAGAIIENLSEDAMRSQVQAFLEESSEMRAKVSDGDISRFRDMVSLIAGCAQEIYEHPERYGDAILENYGEGDEGRLVTYVAYADDVDPSDSDITREVALMNNIQTALRSVNESNDSMATDYFATESGLFFCCEAASEYNTPVDGEKLSFEARQRPWYKEAMKSKEPVFTGMIKDADTGDYAITCGAPVIVNGKRMGVAGAGLFLDTIRDDVDSYRVGENGFACMVNNYGQILFSGSDDSELAAMSELDRDIRDSSNTELASLAKDALDGGSDIKLIELDGEKYYIAYAPIDTVAWSYFTVLPEKEVIKPSADLLKELEANNSKRNAFVEKSLIGSARFLVLFMVIIGIVMYFLAARFAESLSKPVTKLTEKVANLEGDNLDFSWDMNTGDEVQVLAHAFGSMTDRMKKYIDDIVKITAEKERIGAELEVATQIQADMLPRIFPPFPDKKEFDLYATMDPAKEVGGDFYDYFLIDPDHICLVMADVSGKGVPAALFMVITKTLIKNRANMGGSPSEILEYVNDQLCEGNEAEFFATVWLAILEISTGKGVASNAGHEHPIIRRAGGDYEIVRYKHSPAVAVMPGIRFEQHDFSLGKGDSLFVYTDGVPEATRADNELFGNERLLDMLNSNKDKDVVSILKNAKRSIEEFVSGAPQFDDMTMLVFTYKGV